MKKRNVFLACIICASVSASYAQNHVTRSDDGLLDAMQTEMDYEKKEIESQLTGNSFFLEFTASKSRDFSVLAHGMDTKCDEGIPAYACKATITLRGDRVVRENAAQVPQSNVFRDDDSWKSLQEGLRMSTKKSIASVIDNTRDYRLNTLGARFVSLPPIMQIEESAFSTPVHVDMMKSLCGKVRANIAKCSALYDDTLCIALHQADLYRVTSEGQKTRSAECYYMVRFVAYGKNSEGRDSRFVFSKEYGQDQLQRLSSEVEKDLLGFVSAATAACQAKEVEKEISYEGPVLFEGDAAWYVVFKDHEWYNQLYTNAASGRYPMGMDVCHPLVSISQKNDMKSAHRHVVDADGTVMRNVQLVSDGKLVNKVGGRILYDKEVGSTGNYIFSSLIMNPSTRYAVLHAVSAKTESEGRIRKDFIKEAKAKSLPYAYIIRNSYGLSELVEVNVKTGEEMVLDADVRQQDVQMTEDDEFSKEECFFNTLYGGNLATYVFPRMVLMKKVKVGIKKPVAIQNLNDAFMFTR